MASETSLFNKEVFTTGEVAEICNVSQQTVIRNFDSGRLQGFRVPGSRFRRIPRESLVKFMREFNIPLSRLEGGRKRVLVVDDDPDIVEMVVELLERDGRFQVEAAATGFDAGAQAERFQPHVIVLDYRLPDIDGAAVCRSIRSDPRKSGMRIIMMSGVVHPDEIERLRAEGADEFLNKPFSIQQLMDKITELTTA